MQFRFEERGAMDLRSLRFLVLWPHKDKMEDCILEADFLPSTRHFAAFDNENNVLACCTLMPESRIVEGQVYSMRLRAMASHPDVRGSGMARELLSFALGHFLGEKFWCDARLIAVPFYERCGWRVRSEAYEIPIIGTHFLMTS
jgi:predicted GNAT family N-acyltransferase